LNQARESGVAADEINRLVTSIENLNKARGAVTEQATLGPGPAAEEIPGAKIQEFISTAQEGLNDLESYAIRVSQGIGDAVGNSLSNGVAGLIEGTATAKEVFAGFLKDVGQILASEGAKMIATYIAIGIAKMFAGLGGGGGGSDPLKGVGGADWAKYTKPDVAGNFTPNLMGFANGGIVSSPTLFQFADGGVTQTGVMGEAGPEAIMPLERGPDGKLGVSARLDGAMSRYSRPPGAAGGPEGGSGDSASTGGGAAVATAPIDVRYTVERINSVDYVTADQFRAGMAQAAQQGAKQGEQSTLRRLQQSSSTRRRLGM
jgi:phage-related minor tail protein